MSQLLKVPGPEGLWLFAGRDEEVSGLSSPRAAGSADSGRTGVKPFHLIKRQWMPGRF